MYRTYQRAVASQYDPFIKEKPTSKQSEKIRKRKLASKYLRYIF